MGDPDLFLRLVAARQPPRGGGPGVTVNLPGVPALARGIAGVLMGGVITALVFLICVQGSFHEGITDFDFTHVLGTAIEGTATEESGGDALGVIGDSVGPTALRVTIICGIVLLAFHALVIVRLVRRQLGRPGRRARRGDVPGDRADLHPVRGRAPRHADGPMGRRPGRLDADRVRGVVADRVAHRRPLLRPVAARELVAAREGRR